jgi:hypothetical protein
MFNALRDPTIALAMQSSRILLAALGTRTTLHSFGSPRR